MTTTTHLGITLIDQSQAQKEVTANQAFVCLDALLNTGAKSRQTSTPPGSPNTGDLYIVGASPTGAWSGQAGKLTYFNQTWQFITPNQGIVLWVNDEGLLYTYSGSAWTAIQSGSASGFKNRVMNADMRIDQANEGGSVSLSTGTAKYICDGTAISFVNSSAAVSAQRVTDAPSGFSNSLKITVGTGAGSVSVGDYLMAQANIEGYNLADFYYGNSAAAAASLSFWVKSSITGTFSYALQNSAANRAYVGTFSIASASTWTQITIANIVGDSAGTWLTTNGIGLKLIISIASGSTYQTSALGSWQGANVFAATSQTNSVLTTSGATFQVTGVQFEKGTTCTNFDFREYGKELTFCQRYYEKSFDIGTAPAQGVGGSTGESFSIAGKSATGNQYMPVRYKVTKRTDPTITLYNPSNSNSQITDETASGDCSSTTVVGNKQNSFLAYCNGNASTAIGNILGVHWTADARM